MLCVFIQLKRIASSNNLLRETITTFPKLERSQPHEPPRISVFGYNHTIWKTLGELFIHEMHHLWHTLMLQTKYAFGSVTFSFNFLLNEIVILVQFTFTVNLLYSFVSIVKRTLDK